jgi:hypothetical protein
MDSGNASRYHLGRTNAGFYFRNEPAHSQMLLTGKGTPRTCETTEDILHPRISAWTKMKAVRLLQVQAIV